jgi:hypothetical protein
LNINTYLSISLNFWFNWLVQQSVTSKLVHHSLDCRSAVGIMALEAKNDVHIEARVEFRDHLHASPPQRPLHHRRPLNLIPSFRSPRHRLKRRALIRAMIGEAGRDKEHGNAAGAATRCALPVRRGWRRGVRCRSGGNDEGDYGSGDGDNTEPYIRFICSIQDAGIERCMSGSSEASTIFLTCPGLILYDGIPAVNRTNKTNKSPCRFRFD